MRHTPWSRRSWLTRAGVVCLLSSRPTWRRYAPPCTDTKTGFAADEERQQDNLEAWQDLAQRAIDAARTAGAQYADVRLTRTVRHRYGFVDTPVLPNDQEMIGVGIRALVNGYWGFAAAPSTEQRDVLWLANRAVAQAKSNARGTSRTVDLGQYPAVTGTWATPITIDPFAVSIEEKGAHIAYWIDYAAQRGARINLLASHLTFTRQERVTATSMDARFTQTLYQSGGQIICGKVFKGNGTVELPICGIQTAGQGWERLLEANLEDQFDTMPDTLHERAVLLATGRPFTVGRYTVVCDGTTVASLLAKTIGVATQLDRALGYEANASGTSFLDDPLGMVGQYRIAAPAVTVTANRSTPKHLATVKWDDEGVEPESFTLVKDGILTDFQTTREQAAWLAPYYIKQQRPVRSHGCAGSDDALHIPIQHMPNMTFEPNPASVRLEDLIADVPDGILIMDGQATNVDFQERNGLIRQSEYGLVRKITKGRLGSVVTGGAILFNTLDLFKHIVAVGGTSTCASVSHSPHDPTSDDWDEEYLGHWKGEPAQDASHTVTAAAATIANQAIIDPRKRG